MKWAIKRFNQLNVNEVYEILKMRNEVFVVEQQCIYQDCDGKDPNGYHLFAREDGDVAAYLRILDKGMTFDEISIGRVIVAQSYRGKGIAKELMLRAIDFVENELGENVIRISAQEYLFDFYKSLGFEKISEAYLEDGIPHVEMLYKK